MSPEQERHRSVLVGVALIVLVALLSAGGLWLRRHRHETAERRARTRSADAGLAVRVAKVAWTAAEREVTLPGDVRGFYQTTLYAKVAGYLERIPVERGDAVRRGQLIAVIRSPETDEDVIAAEADLIVRRRTAMRARALAPPGVVTRQDLDVAEGSLRAGEAILGRAKALKSYEMVRAPFDGVVTARYVDPGALLPAATGATQAALPLVDVTDSRRLRVTVYVGQDFAAFLREGDEVSIVDPQRPAKVVHAEVSRLSTALDPRSRTMLCEIWVDNHAYDLRPGVFVHVTLHVRVPPAPTVPAEALFVRNGHELVARVEKGRLKFIRVETILNDGKRAQLASELLHPDDRVALDVPTELDEGAPVRAVETPRPAARSAPNR